MQKLNLPSLTSYKHIICLESNVPSNFLEYWAGLLPHVLAVTESKWMVLIQCSVAKWLRGKVAWKGVLCYHICSNLDKKYTILALYLMTYLKYRHCFILIQKQCTFNAYFHYFSRYNMLHAESFISCIMLQKFTSPET